jgi:hypothetical protein
MLTSLLNMVDSIDKINFESIIGASWVCLSPLLEENLLGVTICLIGRKEKKMELKKIQKSMNKFKLNISPNSFSNFMFFFLSNFIPFNQTNSYIVERVVFFFLSNV